MKERKAAAAEQELLDKDDEWKIFRRKSKRVKGKKQATKEEPISEAQQATSEAQEPTAEVQEPAQEVQEPTQEIQEPSPAAQEPTPEAQETAPQENAPEDESGAPTGTAEQVSPTSSPKGESRLKTWFRETFGTRTTKPPAEPQESTTKPEEDQTPSFVGGAALTGATRDDPRLTALSSHPVTENEAPESTPNGIHHDDDAGHDEAPESNGPLRQWSTSTGPSEKDVRHSNNQSLNNGENRRSRLRMNFKNIMRRSEDRNGSALSPKSPTSPTAAQAESAATDTNRPEPARADTAERNELHDSFQEETLPAPPALRAAGERASSSSNRDSRFLEDL